MSDWFPKWIWITATAVVVAQAVAVSLWMLGVLQGPTRNLVAQVLLGGGCLLLLLAVHAFAHHGERLPAPPARLAPVLLSCTAAMFITIYFVRLTPFFLLPYDLGCWSEPIFVLDIIKFRTGAPLYLPAELSNSNTYTFGAPAVTYLLAWLLQHPTSIPLYRFILQGYLAIAALFCSAATWELLKLVAPERLARLSRIWWVFFALASFLFATNTTTTSHNIYAHNEPMVLLVSMVALWMMTKHATTQSPRWLGAMALLPALAFLVKQYLAIWLAVFVVYLWFSNQESRRKAMPFAAVSGCALGTTVGLCLAKWGSSFYFWTFQLLSRMVVSFTSLTDRWVDAAWLITLGLLGGWALLRAFNARAFFGIWMGWLVMLVTGIYTMGTAPYTVYLGSATMFGWSFFLAALAKHWPEASYEQSAVRIWGQAGLGIAIALAVFAGLGHPRQSGWKVSPDVYRYAAAIEREFQDVPADRVLLERAEWVYLKRNLLAKDRSRLLVEQEQLDSGLIQRIRNQEYDRVLMAVSADGEYLRDKTKHGQIGKQLLAHYREVRLIPRVRGMGHAWPYAWMMMADVRVLEPIPREQAHTREPNPGSY